ncbi:hypothetical protein A3A46_04015 [Candidatus Roizmanbacteria bacterium RIFCSPLOWO2_01_FULL_37_13]|nr:MAG: hypothetical protein A3A46_04015 [Candidatus Roizmanbacteria bacterium RIFCSPLOWO2_01_FULL_37_13]
MNDAHTNNDDNYTTTPQLKQTVDALWRLEKIILNTLDFKQVVQKIVDSLLTELNYLELGYRIVVLVLYDEKNNVLKRISISQTDEAKKALIATPIPFPKIDIPLSALDNLCVKVFMFKKPASTSFWPDILTPPFTKEQAVEMQKIVGIKTSLAYPVLSKNKSLGILIFSMTKNENEVSKEEKDLIQGFTDVVGLAVQNAQLYTKLEHTTEKLNRANVKLKQLDELKDEFVSLASHELRTPMTAIKSYLWMVLNKSQNLDPQMRSYLDIASQETEHLIKLVQNMLTISRIESQRLELTLQNLDLFEIVKLVYNTLKIKADEKHLTFTLLPYPEKVIVNADKEKLSEVFENIIGNALKYTPDNGNISIHFTTEKNKAGVHVTDSGPGISEKDLKKLFQKFGRLEEAKQSRTSGTGLGLYISKQIVELHKGSIKIESEVGKGTTFSVYLPLA